MKGKPGRPTKYKKEYNNCDDYLAECSRENTKLPTIEGYSIYLGVNLDSLYEWKKTKKGFSETLNKILKLQKEQLINDGIYGGKEVNATIIKLMLMSNHGMRERNDITTDDKALPVPIYGGKSTSDTE